MMYTNNNGVSYYKRGKKYYCNSGWLEKEITKEEYVNELLKEANLVEGKRKKLNKKEK